jgi:hypothetical protein
MFPLVAPDEKIAEARAIYGRTIQEILSKEPDRDIYRLLGAIEVLVGSKISQRIPTSPAERMVFAMTWLAREVTTGGFRQFFVNTAGDFWKDVLEGLIAVGDQHGLAMFEEALAVFPNSQPSVDRRERLEQLSVLEEKDEKTLSDHLNKMTGLYFSSPFPNWPLVFAYVKSHPDEFDLRNA